MKKYVVEMIGTMVLVLMGCGSAVFNGGCGTPAQVLTVAVAFGLSVVAMAYTIGGISGCDITPAITPHSAFFFYFYFSPSTYKTWVLLCAKNSHSFIHETAGFC